MKKAYETLHRILFSFGICLLEASLIFFLIKLKGLPDETGIHFGSDGKFDVVASKFYGFYPHIIGGLVTAGIAFAEHCIKKSKTGLDLSEDGEVLFKNELKLTLDTILILVNVVFAHWSYCVVMQKPLNLNFLGIIGKIALVIVFTGIGMQIMTCRKYGHKKSKTSDSQLMHRVSRLIAWLLTASGIAYIIASWNRHPIDMELYYDPEYSGLAYFANFDAYLDKLLLLIPPALIIILLTALEVISKKAAKKNNGQFVLLTDRIKLICGTFFFWWNLILASENKVGNVSVCLFVLLCTATFAAYALKKKNNNSAA